MVYCLASVFLKVIILSLQILFPLYSNTISALFSLFPFLTSITYETFSSSLMYFSVFYNTFIWIFLVRGLPCSWIQSAIKAVYFSYCSFELKIFLEFCLIHWNSLVKFSILSSIFWNLTITVIVRTASNKVYYLDHL